MRSKFLIKIYFVILKFCKLFQILREDEPAAFVANLINQLNKKTTRKRWLKRKKNQHKPIKDQVLHNKPLQERKYGDRR